MTEGPLLTYRTRIPPEWVDYNGHFNVGYYMIAFDKATDGLAEEIGLGTDYRRRSGNSFYLVECHLTFVREVMERAPIRIESRVLGVDDKRLHFFHAMTEEAEGYLAATAEMLALHVDLGRRRAAPFAAEPARAIAALRDRQRHLPPPPQLGRAIALRGRGDKS